MDDYQVKDEEIIIIGDLAKIYKVSKRMLRLYHEMGLLIPYYVNEQTGYRYYHMNQLPRLDMILKMKNAGFSLEQIKQMLDMQNLSLFEAVLGEQIDKLDEKIKEYRMNRESLSKQLESCKMIQNPPALNSVFIEYIPQRTAFLYDINSYDLAREYPNGSPWLSVLEQMKSIFLKKDVPLALFQQVGGFVSREDLLRHRFICSRAFIQLDDSCHYGLPLSPVQPGVYACMYNKFTAMDNLEESKGIRQVLDYITAHQYRIAGPYLAQVVAETSVFDYNDGKIIVKQQIPIEVSWETLKP